MSYGLAICSACLHEVHQNGPRDPKTDRRTWLHCETGTTICDGAVARYSDPANGVDVAGAPCRGDEMRGA